MKCNKCQKEKSKSEFPTAFDKRRGKTYIQKMCKKCKYEYTIKWKAENRDKVNEADKEWRYKNWDKYLSSLRKNYHKNIEKRRKYGRELQKKLRDDRGYSGTDIKRNGELAKVVKKSKCEICGTTKNLCIHHKDNKGRANLDKGLKPNNNLNNLQILCRSCHIALHQKLKH